MLARFSRPTFSRDHGKIPAECMEEEGKPKNEGTVPLYPPKDHSSSSTVTISSSSASLSSSASYSSALTSSSSSLPALKNLPPVTITSKTDTNIIIENGYIRVGLNTQQGAIDVLEGSFEGVSKYVSALSRRGDTHGFRTESLKGEWLKHSQTVTIASETSKNVTLLLESKLETWLFQLLAGERVFTLRVAGKRSLQHSFYTEPMATYAFFDGGVVQMMDSFKGKNYMSARDPLVLWYAISGTDSHVSAQLRLLEKSKVAGVVLENSPCCDPKYKTGNVPIEQAYVTDEARALPYHSAIHLFPLDSPSPQDWGSPPAPPSSGREMEYEIVYEIGATDGDFPTHAVPHGVANLPAKDLRGYLTGLFSSPVGAIRTFSHPGLMTPTIWRPEPSYEGNYNFFDPDCFLALSALSYSGDPYLQEQVRAILERTVEFIREDGLMPHHLEISPGSTTVKVTYVAISGATQPGPNIFWTMACLQYVNATGNFQWLEKSLPKITMAVNYVLHLIPSSGLVDAPGPLMIDTLIRTGYTADTNAALVWMLRHLGPMYTALGQKEKAQEMAQLAQSVSAAMNKHLWEGKSNDHYVTSIDPKTGNVLDMVDYDANLIAVAAGVSDLTQSNAILKRIDKGECSHKNGRGTWVSEVGYDASKVYRGDTGDSYKMLARIAWFDGHARKRLRDKVMFDKILDPIVDDLLKYLWLNERYNCEGERSRGYGFIFYPSVSAMLLREIRYGLNVGLISFDILPMFEGPFSYHVGNVHVDYSSTYCRLELVGRGERMLVYQVSLKPDTKYNVFSISSPTCKAETTIQQTDSLGILRFSKPGSCVLEIRSL